MELSVRRNTLCWAALNRMYPCLCYAFLVMTRCVQGDDVTCQKSTQYITVKAEDTVYLPCAFNYSKTTTELLKVTWQTQDQKTQDLRVVHAENSTGFRADTQHESFMNQTRMSANWSRDGNATLRLSRILFQYNGTFICRILAEGTTSQECANVTIVAAAGEKGTAMERSLWFVLPVLLALLSP